MKLSSCTWRRQFMRLAAIVLGSVAGLGMSRLPAQERQPLCDGKTLNGWVQRGGKSKFAIADGVIVGTTVKGAGNSFLCTQRDYGDFILELEIKADPGLNSGVQVRSHCFDQETTYDHGAEQIKIPAGRVHGYQIEVDHRPERRWSGGVYDEARRGWLHPIATNSPASQAFKFGEWNQYRIRCVGGSIKTWINGVPVADLVDTAELSGFIALQVHGADQDGMQVRFRNVRLSDLGAHVWQPVLQGDSLGNSHTLGKGDWKIENGVIHATHSKNDKEYGHLVSDGALTDFTVRMKYKAIQGNSGFYFRLEESGDSGVSGLQAEIDAEKDAGGLYESNGRGWVSRPAPEDVKQWFKPQDWNLMTVTAKGRRIVVEVNGHKTAEILDDTGRTEGPGALQLHGGQDVDVYFKDLEVLTDRG
jgi:hypothetical protein